MEWRREVGKVKERYIGEWVVGIWILGRINGGVGLDGVS